MPDEKLPASVLEFISRHVASVEEVEILRFLVTTAEVQWSVQDVYHIVRSTHTSIRRGLDKFVQAGFVEQLCAEPAAYRSRLTDDTSAVVSDVCKFYRMMPVRVIEAIYKKDRTSIEEFAQAFKFKRKP
jgi:Fe2+ or Zn2+ uptake regulation protein